MQGFDVLDIIFFVFIIIAILIGFFRGVVKELLSLVAWVGAFLISLGGYNSVYNQIGGFKKIDGSPHLQQFWAFLALFIVVLLVLSIIRFVVTIFVSSINISSPNHLLGMILAFLKACLIVYIFLMVFENIMISNKKDNNKSVVFGEAKPYLLLSPDKK